MKPINWLKRTVSDQRGYTLLELIVAMACFALISIVILGALITVMRSSTKTGAERKVQQDARYSIEEIARQARSSSIDYAFYTKNVNQAACGFSPIGANSTRALALIADQAGEGTEVLTKRVIFYYDDQEDVVYRFEDDAGAPAPSCSTADANNIFTAPIAAATGPTRTKVTTNNVTIPSLIFYVSPNQNPYATAPCPANDAPCNIARNTHPRVTILMTAETIGTGVGTNQQKTGRTTLETTVNSRAYPTESVVGPPS